MLQVAAQMNSLSITPGAGPSGLSCSVDESGSLHLQVCVGCGVWMEGGEAWLGGWVCALGA